MVINTNIQKKYFLTCLSTLLEFKILIFKNDDISLKISDCQKLDLDNKLILKKWFYIYEISLTE